MSVSRILKSLTSVRAACAGFEAAFFALQQDRYIITPGDEGIETGHRTLSMYCRLLQQEGKLSISFLDDTTKAAGDYSRFIRSGLCGYSLPQEPFEASHIPGADAGWRTTLTAIKSAFGRCEASIRALQQNIRVLRTSAVPPDAAKALNLDNLCLHETLSIKCQTLIHLYRLLTDKANAIKQMRISRRLAMERPQYIMTLTCAHAYRCRSILNRQWPVLTSTWRHQQRTDRREPRLSLKVLEHNHDFETLIRQVRISKNLKNTCRAVIFFIVS